MSLRARVSSLSAAHSHRALPSLAGLLVASVLAIGTIAYFARSAIDEIRTALSITADLRIDAGWHHARNPCSKAIARTRFRHVVEVPLNEASGQYLARVCIDGLHVRMAIEPGPVDLLLAHEDAVRLGYLSPFAQGADPVKGAFVIEVGRVNIGGIEIEKVMAQVAPDGALSISRISPAQLERFGHVVQAGGVTRIERR